MKILCVCLTPAIQRTLLFDKLNRAKVNRTADFVETTGGKAINAAKVLNQLETGSAFVLCPAGKSNYKRFLRLLKKDGLNAEVVKVKGAVRQCWTLAESDGTVTEIIAEEPAPFARGDDFKKKRGVAVFEAHFLEEAVSQMNSTDALLFAGSCPEYLSEDFCERICAEAKREKKPIALDFKGERLSRLLKTLSPEIIKINEEEFKQTFCGQTSDDERGEAAKDEWEKADDEKKLARAICDVSARLKNIIVVTRGGKAVFAADKGEFALCECEKVRVVNTTACGDAFLAGFLREFLISRDIKSALLNGNHCAALNAQTFIPACIQVGTSSDRNCKDTIKHHAK